MSIDEKALSCVLAKYDHSYHETLCLGIEAYEAAKVTEHPDDRIWEDVHLRICKDDLYKGREPRCISYKGVIYKPERESVERHLQIERLLNADLLTALELIVSLPLGHHEQKQIAKEALSKIEGESSK